MTLTGSWDDSSGVHVFRVRSTYNHGYTQTASLFFFFLMIRPPRKSPLFPYTTLFRSVSRRPPRIPPQCPGEPAPAVGGGHHFYHPGVGGVDLSGTRHAGRRHESLPLRVPG